MSNYKYMKNAFWEKDDRSRVKCIRITDLPDGKQKKDVMTFDKYLPNGNECPKYKDLLEHVSIEEIDQETNDRRERKKREHLNKKAIEEQKKQAAELDRLFFLKLKAFEIDAIKNTTNKKLRSALRRAKNEVELNALAALIIGEAFQGGDDE